MLTSAMAQPNNKSYKFEVSSRQDVSVRSIIWNNLNRRLIRNNLLSRVDFSRSPLLPHLQSRFLRFFTGTVTFASPSNFINSTYQIVTTTENKEVAIKLFASLLNLNRAWTGKDNNAEKRSLSALFVLIMRSLATSLLFVFFLLVEGSAWCFWDCLSRF